MKHIHLKPSWTTIILFMAIILAPIIDGYPAFVLFFTYIKLGEFSALLLILGFFVFAYMVAYMLSRGILYTKNRLMRR
ncbi:MAG: hypothetical protein COV59_03225 [Candidatus Magasanikbacteria bacterium CG11_big_fil_rev_8_21_14_0_20_39_34]|uniref:Uncharacterized protein n=1 Tax=Candidatus Magasanikbacteria bacterium CG11_big_fil_rev_8_21_14_0_20_39_34 TaxID=1974653 RepID=A0A2H0N5J7_9BACT|nr:MAG: hypothetical protein COV59_03225 [Candidatus Magasanikbacteria bacterium CG11_big_fil_rev_8_21_14_0_20_39_34]